MAVDLAAVLSAGLGLREPLTRLPDAVVADARAGKTVAAVKGLRRQAPGLSLIAANRMTDAIARQPQQPGA